MKTNSPGKIGIDTPKIIIPSAAENAVLDRLDKKYSSVVELSENDRRFFNSLLLRRRPKKCLEIGVSAGGSAILILNALKEYGGALTSVDYSEYWHHYGLGSADDPQTVKKTSDSSLLKVGWMLDQYPELKAMWKLHTGGLVVDFIDKIGGGG